MTKIDRTAEGVTVVIPAFNYERFVASAVESALNQDYQGPLEVLVVDDGSTDRTREICASFGRRINYHHKTNEGLSEARNTGMKLAQCDKVLFLDADDLLEKGCVHRLISVWNRYDPCPVVVGSCGRMIDSEGSFLSSAPEQSTTEHVKELTARDFILRNRFPPIVLADRNTLLKLGGFDRAFKASEDRDMWIRAATVGRILRSSESLYRKRDHGSNMSRQAERQTACIFQVLLKARENPMVKLSADDWRVANAICLYQSSRMYLAAGDIPMARRQCIRSLCEKAWLSKPAEVELPLFSRAKFLLLLLLAGMRERKLPPATAR